MLPTAVAVPRVVSVGLSIVSVSKALVAGGKNESEFDIGINWNILSNVNYRDGDGSMCVDAVGLCSGWTRMLTFLICLI